MFNIKNENKTNSESELKNQHRGWKAKHIDDPKRMFFSGICIGFAIGINIGIAWVS